MPFAATFSTAVKKQWYRKCTNVFSQARLRCQKPVKRVLTFILFGLGAWHGASPAAPVVLDPGDQRLALGAHLSVLRDETRQLRLEDVQKSEVASAFKPSGQAIINRGFDRAAYWYRAELVGSMPRAASGERWILELAYSAMDDVQFYIGHDGLWQSYATGDSRPFIERRIHHRHLLLPLDLPQGETRVLLIRAVTEGPHNFPLTLWRSDAYFEHAIVEYGVLGLFYGIMLVMVLYNLFVYFAVREAGYLYYIGFIFSVVLMQSSLDGTGPQFVWGAWPDWSNISPTVAVSLINLSAAAFSRSFLETAQRDAFADRLLRGVMAASLLMPFTLLLMPYALNLRINSMLALLMVCLCITAAVRALLSGHRAARLYLLGWGFFMFAGFLRVLHAWGLTVAAVAVEYSMQVGMVMIVTMFALALGDRINALRQERITLSQQRQRAEASTQAKSEFLAKMSHELRTPMNAVIGFTELALRSQAKPQRDGYLEHIRGASRSLLGIINDILDISKIEAGKLQLEQNDFELAPLLSKLQDMFHLAASKKSLHLTVHADARLPQALRGDPLRLEQVLVNLLNNAVKFTERGAVELSVQPLESDAESCLLEFCVRDSGPGISADKAAALFTPFTQADDSITRRYGGTGLGLAICKQLVEMMGGQIRLDTRPGAGSRFYFTARFARVQLAAVAAGAGAAPERMSLHGRRLLLVEDNPLNQLLAAELLRGEGATVDIAGNGSEALSALGRQTYDLVLMDMQMPVMDGLEATRRIRAGDQQPQVTILAMTANAMEQDREQCLAAGMNDFISKPIDFSELNRVLTRWLAGGRTQAGVSRLVQGHTESSR